MKAWEIVGFAYGAALHCADCSRKAGMTKKGAVDTEGNEPSPLFASSEDWKGATCSDCGAELGE